MDAQRRWRSCLIFCLLSLGLLGAPSVSAQILWKKASVGMGVEAVQQLFPSAARPAAPTKLADGSCELLRLRGTVIQGHGFDALFFFNASTLRQVNLELQESGGAVFALQTYRGIKDAFDAKYGPPDDEQDQTFQAPTGTASFRSASWRSGRTWITLSYATAGGRLVVMNVAYRAVAARDADDI